MGGQVTTEGHQTHSRAREEYERLGYVVFPQAIPRQLIDDLLSNYLSLVEEVSGQAFADAGGADLARYLEEHPEVTSEVYTSIRERPWLEELSLDPSVVEPVRAVIGEEVELLGKIPFRIDVPRSVQELAWWHQDYFYVRGNTSIVTAWVPMQDTRFLQGALTVMPGSHLLGAVSHDLEVGKRHVPSTVFDREIRMVELEKGDLLLFDSLLLHSGNLNMSDSVRYSVQARYTPAGGAVDPDMGGAVRAERGGR
jgi:ectoine hydroxylase-related dioxygenase (phytanoyl-CoA dioxygenase family)